MAACPRLTELTIIFPHRRVEERKELPPIFVERVRSAISDLADACKALQDFDTLQVARFPLTPSFWCWCYEWPDCGCGPFPLYIGREEQALEKEMRRLEEWAIECLKRPKIGCPDVAGRRSVLRSIKFGSSWSSVEVDEYEV